MPADRLRRSTAKGVLIFLVSATLYVGCLALAASAPYLWLQLIGSLDMGLQAGVLFVIAHDACHGSLTASMGLNRFIATISFLPALHPYTTWKYTHNGLHHGWTNVRGKEIVYVPFSKEDFDRLPKWCRAAERFFRSWAGVLAFYFFTVYVPYEIFPNRERGPVGKVAWRAFQFERLLVLAFALGVVAATYLITRLSGRPFLPALFF